MVPDDSLTIRERAVAAWPTAWQGQNLRDILVTLGYDVDRPWRALPKTDRDWILFTDEQPTVPVYAGLTPAEARRALKRKEEPSYMGTFTSARRYVLHTFANSDSALMKRRVAQYMLSTECAVCHGKRLRREALSVTFAGYDIADLSRLPLKRLREVLRPVAEDQGEPSATAIVAQRIADDLVARLGALLDLGLGYLTVERSTPTLSPGELQRLRLATQVRSNLFGVVYVLDEPSAGLHPADTEALLAALDRLKASGNSLFVVEHDLDVIRHADWIVDVGPAAGEQGGDILYSGPPAGLAAVELSETRRHLFGHAPELRRTPRTPVGWLRLDGGDAQQPARSRRRLSARRVYQRHRRVGVRQVEPGESGARRAGCRGAGRRPRRQTSEGDPLERTRIDTLGGRIVSGMDGVSSAGARRSEADRPHAAIEPGDLHRAVRPRAEAVRVDQGGAGAALRRGALLVQRRARAGARTVRGEGFVMVELLFLAERLCAVPGVPRIAVQREDARDSLPRQVDRRCARADGRCGVGLLRRRAARSHARSSVLREVGLGTCGSGSRRRSCPAARRSGSSWRPSCSARSAAARYTSSTSRRPVCTRRTSRSCCVSSTAWSTPAIR